MARLAPLLATGFLLLPVPYDAPALDEKRIEGVVNGVRVTHCDVTKAGGCAGTLTLELKHPVAGGAQAFIVWVPLGTPISCGSDRVHLHRVQGRTVVVTLFSGGEVARAVQVAEAESC